MYKNFLDYFSELAAEKPDHVTMVDLDGTRSTTLKQMEDLICRITAKIESKGFPLGSFLLIRMSRRMEYVAAYYGAILERLEGKRCVLLAVTAGAEALPLRAD